MRNVLKKDKVAHMWANRQQESGRNAGGNFYFDRDTIYSYGGHFPIAKHVQNDKGEKVVLFTYRGYSNTTAKQINVTRNAASHLDKIYCNTPTDGHIAQMQNYLSKIQSELHGLDKAKKPEKYINPAKYYFGECQKYAKFFGVKIPKEITKLMSDVDNGKYKEYLALSAKRIERERKAIEKRELAQHFGNLAKWRMHEGSHTLYSRNEGIDYLRFNGKRVETSQGVEIPLQVAKNTFKWIIGTIKLGGCKGECDYRVLDYIVSEVTPDLITIGCHKITLTEINNLAKSLKWI